MGMATQAYLVAYNAGCLAGWGFALFTALSVVAAGDGDAFSRLGGVWAASGQTVLYVQYAMALEIFHAAFGLVRSPLLTTALQVTSRLWVVLLPVAGAPCDVGAGWATGLMVLSWSTVEVIRYAFYLSALLLPKVPYPIFWARYTAFAILYPSGITGELGTAFAALECAAVAPYHSAIWCIVYMYIPGGPFMYMNMVGNRKGAFKKRFAKPPPPPRGCAFPLDKKGARSTSAPNRSAIAAAIEGCGARAAAAAAKCRGCKNWRFGYASHVKALVRQGAYAPAAALGSAKAGLAYLYEAFEFVDKDGAATPFGQALSSGATVSGRTLQSAVVKGAPAGGAKSYDVPYDGGWHPSTPKPPVATMTGAALKSQLERWVSGGVVERDAADAIQWTSDFFAGGGSLSGAHFVLIGAGSAMGPCAKLLQLGANVVAIDIPGSWGKGGPRPASGLWKRLFGMAQASPGGSLTVPVTKGFKQTSNVDALAEAAGCNLMEEPREIAAWLAEWVATLPRTARVCIGNYTYLDGELHVKLALCADHLIATVLDAGAKRLSRPPACAFLCTPTDAHLVPAAAASAAEAAYGGGLRSLGLEKLFNLLTMGAKLKPNVCKPVETAKGPSSHMVDGLSVAQGPNYALAKRMQHWRAVVAFESGHVASTMVAPSTATLSVIHNKTFAWAYGGMPTFGYEIFKQETTNAVMSAVLVHDVLNDAGPKHPKNRAKFGVDNALKLFASESVHGGLWRSPYTVDSLGEASAGIYFFGLAKPYLIAAGLAAAAVKYLA